MAPDQSRLLGVKPVSVINRVKLCGISYDFYSLTVAGKLRFLLIYSQNAGSLNLRASGPDTALSLQFNFFVQIKLITYIRLWHKKFNCYFYFLCFYSIVVVGVVIFPCHFSPFTLESGRLVTHRPLVVEQPHVMTS